MTAFDRVKTALVLLAATLPLTEGGHLLAADVTLSGHILDDADRPLDFARLSVEAGGKRILEQEVQLSADGELRIALGSVAYDQVRCYIASDGFDQVQ